jgi:hypothetical protein
VDFFGVLSKKNRADKVAVEPTHDCVLAYREGVANWK